MLVGIIAVAIAVTLGLLLGPVAGYYGGASTPHHARRRHLLRLPLHPVRPPPHERARAGVPQRVHRHRRVQLGDLCARHSRPGPQRQVHGVRRGGPGPGRQSDLRIIFRHVVPNSMAPVYVAVAMAVGGAIATEAALSFLGIGIQPPGAWWGIMISDRSTTSRPATGGGCFPQPGARHHGLASSRSATGCVTPPTPNSRSRRGPATADLKDLSTHFFTHAGIVKAVNGVSFRLDRGETIGMVGKSGSGKTVAAMSLMRLVPDPPGNVVEDPCRGQGPAHRPSPTTRCARSVATTSR